jgi:stearoyl-CoA desaturase (Delta-9 desaturase)
MTGKQRARQTERVTRMTTGGSVLITENQRPRAYLRKVLVLMVVIGPFLATAFAIVQLWDRAVNWRDVALFVSLYAPISLGVTAGFHRMLTHRSFRAHPVVRAALLVFGSMA